VLPLEEVLNVGCDGAPYVTCGMIGRLWEDCPLGWDEYLSPKALAFFMGRSQVTLLFHPSLPSLPPPRIPFSLYLALSLALTLALSARSFLSVARSLAHSLFGSLSRSVPLSFSLSLCHSLSLSLCLLLSLCLRQPPLEHSQRPSQ
jgi:hypothetical protein